jgi:hypothetical protein
VSSKNTQTNAWPTQPMETVVDRIFLGLADARHRGGEEREVPVLNVRDLRDGHVPPREQLATRPVSIGADVERYAVRADDVVVTCRGTQLRVAQITKATEGAVISANLIAIRAGASVVHTVLLAFLQSPDGHQALLQRARSSTSSISLTPKSLGGVPLPVPPREVQHQIAELVGAGEQNYVAAIRAAEQRRSVARAIAFQLLQGDPRSRSEEHT